jgi:uncharacterized integral membrane protein
MRDRNSFEGFPMTKFLTTLILAFWVAAIAIIAVQNATPVSLNFFGLRSIAIPFGVLLAFLGAGSMLLTTTLITLLESKPLSRLPKR